MEHCLDCGTELGVVDEDPNGDKNHTCARCRAEEAHDFDLEPDVRFSRSGSPLYPLDPEELFVVSALSRKGVAEELNEYLEACGSKIERLTPGDPRLTSEIMEFLAKKSGEISHEWTGDAINDFWQEALFDSLIKMGYTRKQIGI
jgi:hypothetical protein